MSGQAPAIATPPITGTATVTYLDQASAMLWSSRLMRFCIAFLVVMLVLLVLGVFGGGDDDDDTATWILLGVLALWAVMPAITVWRLSPQQRALAYEVDGEHIVVKDGAGNAVTFPWTQVRTCREGGRGFVLRRSPGICWLAKRAFTPPALAAFRALAREKLGARAQLKP